MSSHLRRRRVAFFRIITFLLVVGGLIGSGSSASAATSKERVLYNFSGGTDGSDPSSTLIADRAGNLYGTTGFGGDFGDGTIFELSRTSTGWTHTVLYNFTGNADGGFPQGGLAFDAAGNLYGTTGTGGFDFKGNVYRLSPNQGTWTLTVLYSFTGGADGGYAYGGIVPDAAGNLYGTANEGGSLSDCNGAGCGVVYELSPNSSGVWIETVLHAFNEVDGALPGSSLVFDGQGNLYGTTSAGGTSTACQGFPANGCGTVFRLAPSNGTWALTTLHNFFLTSTDGLYPEGLTYHQGRLFGVTFLGGKLGGGTAFEVTLTKSGVSETVLHSFGAASDGANPVGAVTFDQAGNFYGVSRQGANSDCSGLGCGSVFAMTPAGGGWSEKVLYRFTGSTDGGAPQSNPALGPAGSIVGTAASGGAENSGVVYELPLVLGAIEPGATEKMQ